MKFFTSEEFVSKYTEYESIPTNMIMEASEMIFAQVSPLYRNNLWNDTNVPEAVKNASMEQARFLLAYEIPHIDTNELKAGNMQTKLKTEYSTLALTILANAGFLYRGNPINQNMSLGIEFGGE